MLIYLEFQSVIAINFFRHMSSNSYLLGILFFTNVIQGACLSNFVIPSDVQLTLDALSKARSFGAQTELAISGHKN